PSVDTLNGVLPAVMISDTLVLSGTVGDQPAWGGAVARFHFEEGAGASTYYDYTTHNNNATCINCPTAATGPFGQAVAFDGIDNALLIADDDRLDVGSGADAASFSISLWVQPDNWYNNQHAPFVSKGNGSGDIANYYFGKWNNGDEALTLSYYNGGWVDVVDDSGEVYVNGVWVHLAVVADATNNTVRFYKNGRLLSLQTNDFSAQPLLPNSEPLVIGQYPNSGNALFDGQIDELAVYGRVLTAHEIHALAQAAVTGVDNVGIGLEIVDFDAITVTQPINWTPATLDAPGAALSTWQYQLPAGLEDFYQVHLRGSDVSGHVSRRNAVWRGSIDTLAPRVVFYAYQLGGSSAPQTQYYFTVDDLFLDESSLLHVCAASDLTSGYHDNPARLNQISGYCRLPGHQTGDVSVTACDYAGHCTTETITLPNPPNPQESVAILTPTNHAIISGTTTLIDINGGAFALGGIDEVSVMVNGSLIDTFFYGGTVTDTTWATTWTPTATGTYTITAMMMDTTAMPYDDTVIVTFAGYVLDVTTTGTGTGTVSSDPVGIDCGIYCVDTFAPSTVVTLTAVPTAGSIFNGWSGACTGTDNCVVTMNTMQSVTAEFAIPEFNIFLPIVTNNYPLGPDLIVDELTVSGNEIEVVITNVGDTAVTDEFWVDVYIDPAVVPTAVNQTIESLNCDGAVWGVTNSALPLLPGESLTLTLNDAYFDAGLSRLNLPVGVGTAVYAQVDSTNANTTYGGVLESHERRG
ncbi:MAG: LamG domain-containing protein, partial [Chloroflexi bacterium]|nr:LamG domain-containing protein [Chloroflexota bacterium]